VSSVSETGDVSGASPAQHGRLKREVLNSLEVGAQSVAGMAPSAAMAVNVLLVFLAGARGGTWPSPWRPCPSPSSSRYASPPTSTMAR
jgi:hypothetical protein